MKKMILALTTLLFSSHVFAAATLRIPIYIEGDRDPIPAIEINKKLKAVGAPLIPLYVEVSTGEDGYEKFKALDQLIEKSLAALGKDYEYVMRDSEMIPAANAISGFETCYKGNPHDVPGVASSLTDVAYSDQMNLWGYKFKNHTELLTDDDEDGFLNNLLSERSDLWKNWNSKNDDILILSAVGDSGDDVNESVISKCK